MTELLPQNQVDSFKAKAAAISHPHEMIVDLLRHKRIALKRAMFTFGIAALLLMLLVLDILLRA